MVTKIKGKIPDYLIREVIYEQPYYYKNYQKILKENQTLDSIKGKDRLQSILLSILSAYFTNIFEENYWILSNEAGLHLDKNDNISMDLALLKKSNLPIDKIDTHYFEEIPECVIEVDVNIDLTAPQNQDYVFQKTQRLLDFGVSQVIWILTKSRKIMIAKPNEAWLVDNWNREVIVLEQSFVLEDLLKKKGLIE